MGSDRYIKAILYVAVFAWAAVLLIEGQTVKSAWLAPLSTVTSIVLLAVMAFDLWLWKLSFLHNWFVKRPVIDGIWRVNITSNWVEPSTGKPIAPIEGYMAVRQTFATLSLRLLTKESNSELVGTEIVCSADGVYCISGVYRNEPRYDARQRSAIHYGAVWLRVIEKPTLKIEGQYWTDRNTAGTMILTDRRGKTFQDFDSARAYFKQQSGF